MSRSGYWDGTEPILGDHHKANQAFPTALALQALYALDGSEARHRLAPVGAFPRAHDVWVGRSIIGCCGSARLEAGPINRDVVATLDADGASFAARRSRSLRHAGWSLSTDAS